MAKKANKNDVSQLEERNGTLVFKVNRPVSESQFKLLSDMVRNENEKSGVNVVLVPHSADPGDQVVSQADFDKMVETKDAAITKLEKRCEELYDEGQDIQKKLDEANQPTKETGNKKE